MLHLRALVFEMAQATATGPLTATLKWGEPAYLTTATRAGTTLRLSANPEDRLPCRILVHCQTTLIDQYRDRFGDVLQFEGNRAVRLPITGFPEDAVRHCMALALTYHRDK